MAGGEGSARDCCRGRKSRRKWLGQIKSPVLPLVKQEVSASGTDGKRIHSMAKPEEVEEPEIKSL